MSSSAEDCGQARKPLDWYDFSGREVPDVRSEFLSPESELVSVANRAAEDLHRAEHEAHAAANEVREALFDLAVLVGRLEQLTDALNESLDAKRRRSLHRQLRAVKNQMLQIMTDNGIELRDPTGLPSAEVLDWVEVNAWLHRPEFDTEVVARTEERAVLHKDKVVRFARVLMGAPTESEQRHDAERNRGEV